MGIYYYRINVITETKGYAKSIVCVWCSYKTILEYDDVEGKVQYNNGNLETDFNIFDKHSIGVVRSISGTATAVYGSTTSSTIMVNMLSDVYFTEDHGKASSRGVGSLWAIINYN